ncbi:fungal-specific transcription factor domain-containing protein [Bisporella sp. PMI_857]|nr:fungal-specific transcription factor domain-containing protein [Bisporella sp. PMI_857]
MDCKYLPSVSNSASKRSRTSANIKQEDSESPKRIKKVEDPLNAPVLTRKVWYEAYDIFKLHFSTEMPFLHAPTFKHLMCQASYPRDPSVTPTDLQDARALLLAVLTLTARFHPGLVAYHSCNLLDASEYYATALKAAIHPIDSILTSPSIYNIQALLMLGLYEWGQTRGLSAWIFICMAIRLAQAMKLSYEDCYDNRTFDRTASQEQDENGCEKTIEIEVRRRTLWSCFIMDRTLSAGKHRASMISLNQLKVQLPCSDDQFLFDYNVRTSFLDKPVQPNGNSDGVLGWYIRLVEIFGRLSEWSFAGGRRTETLPPWNSSSKFYKLRQELEHFHQVLPSNLAFTEAHLSAHIGRRNATTYASMHTLYSLCRMMLHREYIPFIPLRCKKPQGPLDEPIFPENEYHVPKGFWEESAEEIFEAARVIVDIVRTCQDHDALPESPQIGFALWQAAFVCLYAFHFPDMDVDKYLHLGSDQNNNDYWTNSCTDLTVKILGDMVPRLEMAKGFLKTFYKMHAYFSKVKTEIWFGGGGLEQYMSLEKELTEFGSLDNTNIDVVSDGSKSVDQACSKASTKDIGKGSVKGDAIQPIAVNFTNPANENDNWKFNTGHGYQCNPSYQQSPALNFNGLNFVSPGESTLGINFPYVQSQPYLNSGQQQHLPVSMSAGQYTSAMAPPNVQGELRQWSQEVDVTWIARQEGTNASSNYDNGTQLDYAETQIDGLPADMQNFKNQNYSHNHDLWSIPNTVVARQGGFY